jgi:hypothetical protein
MNNLKIFKMTATFIVVIFIEIIVIYLMFFLYLITYNYIIKIIHVHHLLP